MRAALRDSLMHASFRQMIRDVRYALALLDAEPVADVDAKTFAALLCKETVGHRLQVIAEIQATLPVAEVPAGWRLVPVEPTQEMLAAYQRCDDWLKSDEGHGYAVCSAYDNARGEPYWKVMVAAAPETPAAPVQVQACRPEDRAMLATPEGQELLRCVVAAMRELPENKP